VFVDLSECVYRIVNRITPV